MNMFESSPLPVKWLDTTNILVTLSQAVTIETSSQWPSWDFLTPTRTIARKHPTWRFSNRKPTCQPTKEDSKNQLSFKLDLRDLFSVVKKQIVLIPISSHNFPSTQLMAATHERTFLQTFGIAFHGLFTSALSFLYLLQCVQNVPRWHWMMV